MKKQISLLAVSVSVASLLLASSSAFAHKGYKENYKAEPCPVELVLRDGLYIGLQAGYDAYRFATDAVVVDDDLLGTVGTLSADPVLFAGGAVGGGFIGYGKYFDQFYGMYLGLEIFGNWSGASGDYEVTLLDTTGGVLFDADRYESDIKVKSNYGIDVIPGIKLNPATLFYVRLGYNWANIHWDHSFRNADLGLTAIGFDHHETAGGFHYGVGIEGGFWDNWSLRAEFTHTDFSDFDGHDNDNEAIVINSVFADASVGVADNQFMLGIVYHINW